MKIVVTGTIGSGKSTLCAALATRLPGFSVVSVDDIVRSIYDDADFLTHLSNDFGVVSRKEASDQASGLGAAIAALRTPQTCRRVGRGESHRGISASV